ncbi:MAG: DUF1127 domain-containing protein [Pseudomonadota bacterium]
MSHILDRSSALDHHRARLLQVLAIWRRNWRTRRALSRLGPDLLRDIGVSTSAAQQEAARPFWSA